LYVTVSIGIPRTSPGVVIPADAIIFNGQGLRVAVVDGGTVHMRDVSIYRDFGTTVELRSGLQGGELVALTLPTTVDDGGKVALPKDTPKSGEQESQQASSGG
jgi:multidrug efflux pump subunit AcrA (membrane-fusion protein)